MNDQYTIDSRQATKRIAEPPTQPDSMGHFISATEKTLHDIETRLCGAEDQLSGPRPTNSGAVDKKNQGLIGAAEDCSRRARAIAERLNMLLTQIGI